MNPLLNAGQARALQITLRLFEEHLRRADAYLDGALENGTLYHQIISISPDRCARIRVVIDEALAELAALAQELCLETEPDDVGATIRATMSACWANLADARTGGLRRYGSVDPALVSVLDPTIERLAELALTIATLADEPTRVA